MEVVRKTYQKNNWKGVYWVYLLSRRRTTQHWLCRSEVPLYSVLEERTGVAYFSPFHFNLVGDVRLNHECLTTY